MIGATQHYCRQSAERIWGLKRVINGISLNTETAIKVALADFGYEKRGEPWREISALYRSPAGGWFIVGYAWPVPASPGVTPSSDDILELFKACTIDQAVEWIGRGKCKVLQGRFLPAIGQK